MSELNYIDHVFHNASSSTGNGTALIVGGRNTLTIEISKSEANSARTITFYGKGASGALIPISGVNREGLSAALTATAVGDLWQFDDIAGIHAIVMDLTAITAGTVTVTGRLV